MNRGVVGEIWADSEFIEHNFWIYNPQMDLIPGRARSWFAWILWCKRKSLWGSCFNSDTCWCLFNCSKIQSGAANTYNDPSFGINGSCAVVGFDGQSDNSGPEFCSLRIGVIHEFPCIGSKKSRQSGNHSFAIAPSSFVSWSALTVGVTPNQLRTQSILFREDVSLRNCVITLCACTAVSKHLHVGMWRSLIV